MDKLFNFLMPYLPENASSYGHKVDAVIGWTHLLMLVLFVGWAIFFIYTLIRFRSSKNQKANYTGVTSHLTTYTEVGVAILEVILLVALSIPFWYQKVAAFPNEKKSVVIRVLGQQFTWNIHYPGADNTFGKTNIKYIDEETNPIGLDYNDPNATDDITTINQLHLPVNKPVILHLSSKDVIHSFSIPVMRVKQDLIPGMSIPIWFEPTKTGDWEIACAQLCGLGHYRMRGYLTVHTASEYEKWLADEAAALLEEY